MLYRWSKFSDLYGSFGQRKGLSSKIYFIRQAFRYFPRCLLAQKQIAQFVQIVNQDEKLIRFFLEYRGDYRIVCVNFIDRLLTPQDRLELIKYNLSFISKLPHFLFEAFLKREEILLFEHHEGMKIVLKVNGTFEEGFFALEIKAEENRIYGASFCFVPEGENIALLIPSLQGLSQGEKTREMIKTITKQCFGLRPQMLLVELMRFIVQYKGYSALFGIPQTLQARYAPFGNKKGYFADYDAMWEECGGTRQGRYFNITQERRKSLEEIPSQKRSMYKKRFVFLDEFQLALNKKFQEMGF